MHVPQLLKPTLAAGAALLALVLLGACSKDKNVDEPAKLTPLPHPSVHVTHLWGHNMGDKHAAVLRLGQAISITDQRVYAAGHHGDVVALDLANGKVLWHAKTRAPLSGGTASSSELVVVGASDGQVFAFDAANGHSRWKVRLNGEILAPAAISAAGSAAHGRWQAACAESRGWARVVGDRATGTAPVTARHCEPGDHGRAGAVWLR